MRSTTASATASALFSLWARRGLPTTMFSDGGPPFASSELRELVRDFSEGVTTQICSSPTHSQSNGMVERQIQTIKARIIKCNQSKTNLHKALLRLRTIPA